MRCVRAVFYIKAAVPRDPSHAAHCNTDISTGRHWQSQTKTLTHLNVRASWGGGAHIKYCYQRMWHVWKLNRYADIHFSSVTSCGTPSPCPRDDSFSDTLSQKADSEASSGHTGEDRGSGKDMASPTDTRISEAYITRSVGSVGILVHRDREKFLFSRASQ